MPRVAAGEVSEHDDRGGTGGELAASGARSGSGAGGAGTGPRRHAEPRGAQRRARPGPARAVPSSLSSTARRHRRPLRGAEERTQAAYPTPGSTTLVCSAACGPTKPKPKRLPSHAVVDAEPDERRRRLRERGGVERVADCGHDGEHRRRCGRRDRRRCRRTRRCGRPLPRVGSRAAKRGRAPISAPVDAGSAPTRPPTVTVVRVTPIVVGGGVAGRRARAGQRPRSWRDERDETRRATARTIDVHVRLLDRDDAAARVRHLHRVRGAVARHERAARRGQRVRGRERRWGRRCSATWYVNFGLAALSNEAGVSFLPAFCTAARKRSADQ